MERFNGKKKVCLIPSSWLNAVASFIDGIHSKKRTITLDYGSSGGAPSIDVDVDKTARLLRPHLSSDFVCKNDLRLLGPGLKWTADGLTIDKEWFARQVISSLATDRPRQ